MKHSSRNSLPTVAGLSGVSVGTRSITLGCRTPRPEIIHVYHFSGACRPAGGVFCSGLARPRPDALQGLAGVPGIPGPPPSALLSPRRQARAHSQGGTKVPGNRRVPALPHGAFQPPARLAAAQVGAFGQSTSQSPWGGATQGHGSWKHFCSHLSQITRDVT